MRIKLDESMPRSVEQWHGGLVIVSERKLRVIPSEKSNRQEDS